MKSVKYTERNYYTLLPEYTQRKTGTGAVFAKKNYILEKSQQKLLLFLFFLLVRRNFYANCECRGYYSS